MEQIFAAITDLRSTVSDGLNGLNSKIDTVSDGLNSKIDTLDEKVDGVSSRVMGVDNHVGDLLERSFRTEIAAGQGSSFAQPMHTCKLEELVAFVLEGEYSQPAPMSRVWKACVDLCLSLAKDKPGESIARCLHSALKHMSIKSDDVDMKGVQALANDHPWVKDNETVDANMLEIVHNKLKKDEKHAPLRRLMQVLLRLLGKDDNEVAQLLLCAEGLPLPTTLAPPPASAPGSSSPAPPSSAPPQELLGASIMLLHFKAAPDLHFTPKKVKKFKDISLPAFELEADVRGSIQIYSSSAVVRVGEVKRSENGIRDGKVQLEERLAVYEWVVKVLFPGVQHFIKVGILFFPFSAVRNAGMDELERADQLKASCKAFSLQVVYLK